jgi:hypothetical protein
MRFSKYQEAILRRLVNGSHINDFGHYCTFNRYPKDPVSRDDVRSMKRRGLIEMVRPGNWDLTIKGKVVGGYYELGNGA